MTFANEDQVNTALSPATAQSQHPKHTATTAAKSITRLSQILRTMSPQAHYSTSTAPAPWRSAFLEQVQNKMDSPEFVLSTLQPAPEGSPFPYVPHARYCIFRGLWAELPENKHNPAPKNERIFESDMPTFTTDVRMQKAPQIFASGIDGKDAFQGSGGGGPVEAVWWVKEVMTQWRIKGQAFVVGPDVEESSSESGGVATLKNEVSKRMRVVKQGSEKEWSWHKEVTGHFGNISPAMRGTFKQPPPGRPADEPYNDKEEVMGSKVEDLDDPVSRKNFRVVIIRPDEVEQTDLSNPGKSRRQKYTYEPSSDSWKLDITWP